MTTAALKRNTQVTSRPVSTPPDTGWAEQKKAGDTARKGFDEMLSLTLARPDLTGILTNPKLSGEKRWEAVNLAIARAVAEGYKEGLGKIAGNTVKAQFTDEFTKACVALGWTAVDKAIITPAVKDEIKKLKPEPTPR
ncbi:MAG: hypothetical protein EOO71_05855 [Myxococcaceae bacterium]|nr:MAG: hypothetical protein EOO71_05855 [Myxococcaceae bacterium]